MSLLAWSVLRALRALRCGRRLAALLGGGFVLFFMTITGFTASCVRAGIMMLLLLAGELFSRKADSLNSLGLAAMALTLLSPLSAGQLGLELSFGATLGIVLFQSRFSAPARKWKKCRWARPLWEGLSVTAAALVLTAPISLLRLPGGVSLLTFPANLLFVPLSGAAMILGGLSLAIAPLSYLAAPLCDWTLRGVRWLSGLPAPVLRGEGAALAPVFAFCAVIAALALLLRYFGKPVRLRYTAALLCAALVLCGWLPGALQSRKATLQRLETGAGAAYLLSQGGRAALLGCGGDELPAGAAKRALGALGIRQLELLLLPGDDESLSGGAAQLRRDVPVRRVLDAADCAEGFTPFALWEGAQGVFYADHGDIACFVAAAGGAFIIQFSGGLPGEWKEAGALGAD
jgi:competence protein ComEC